MAGIEDLVDDLERSYREAQERLSDPSVYNDHREAAEVGRRLKELEGPFRLAQDWRKVRADLDAARGDAGLRELVPELEELSSSPNDGAGFKEITFAVKGDGAYSVFKWEGGTHRVQRVPETESQGRIHTSTATVAVMPEAEEVEVERAKQQAELDAQRRSQVGSGERAEKIRTYNFPENRVTDHRVKVTTHQLDRVLEGDLDDFTEALTAEEQRRALE